ncbi:plasmid maintenance system antidote protein VapI [Kribbella orskensis]|uniref:Plasmid maintenance system antidote protein VapI n=1 Tax=Kribbella orskensis TaxID=2512216 RepID=A0ABY2BJE8_9ACTN|nr:MULTISPECIES: ImmA/IrrE family metallo-endopeptidase [Kribbella]TCN39317.1 plasmid maintenance system antidote protein VapI [Kribbella sp. VKM Ac-2500]TCO21964.1 plasmid maintenance system antidote protein VapI [Kribbella orskensis]
MPSNATFAPRWASPPGDTIREALDERGLSLTQFADMMACSPERASGLLDGAEPISLELGRRLADTIGATTQFWMSRDAQYRDDLDRVNADRWAESLPTAEMRKLGWLPKTSDWHERLDACLQFFGVPDLRTWDDTYGSLLATAKFRTSPKIRTDEAAVAVWLRQGEVEAQHLNVGRWNPARFRDVLADAKSLTREKDPAIFLPALTTLCASAGVAIVVVRSPQGCPASGVARRLGSGNPLLVLSGRHRSDDHLWFTFFHEAAHALLHDPGLVFVDELAPGSPAASDVEREADKFAEDILCPRSLLEMLPSGRITTRDVIRASRAAGVAPGIVVGQLQHNGMLGYDQLNSLKRRYRWNGSNLEIA